MLHRRAPSASELMVRDIRTIDPDLPVEEVAQLLMRYGLADAPVAQRTEQGSLRMIGLISERDCLAHLSDECYHDRPARDARAIMKRCPLCVRPETDLFTLVSIFVQHGYRNLPVVEATEELVGVVGRRDVLRELCAYLQEVDRESHAERFPVNLREISNLRFILSGAPVPTPGVRSR